MIDVKYTSAVWAKRARKKKNTNVGGCYRMYQDILPF
jgi:hypothetical protein